jgi:hypothetical protein
MASSNGQSVVVGAGSKTDAIRVLRAALKVLGRRFGLRANSIRAEPERDRGASELSGDRGNLSEKLGIRFNRCVTCALQSL